MGWRNYLKKDEIVAFIDARTAAARKLKKALLNDRNAIVLDLSSNRRAATFILLKGNRLVISALPRIRLAKRFDAVTTVSEEDLIEKPRKRCRAKTVGS